ncbi:MAG: hypothetical protein WC907_07675 [Acholeplasmataceae bacterium]
MQLLILITEHNQSKIILNELSKDFNYFTNGFTFLGKGTASREILETLSLAKTEKDVSLILVKDSDLPIMLKRIDDKFNLTQKGKGIAFGVKLNSISSKTLEILKKEYIGGNNNE